MRVFKISKEIEVVCEWVKTRTAFKHEATLILNGSEQDKTKICYQNRTWERFKFQSVCKKLINNTKELNKEQKDLCLNFFDGDLTDWSDFKLIFNICKVGEVLNENQKDKNAFKTRILKAGLEKKGLSFPKDWDNLSDEEKTKRLNLVTEQLNKH